MKSIVGLPGDDPPPQRAANWLNPTSSSIRLDIGDVHVACETCPGPCAYTSVSGARVALPPSIHPGGLSRHAPVIAPGQAAPEHPLWSSQNRFSLLRGVSCHVRRALSVRRAVSLRACRVKS